MFRKRSALWGWAAVVLSVTACGESIDATQPTGATTGQGGDGGGGGDGGQGGDVDLGPAIVDAPACVKGKTVMEGSVSGASIEEVFMTSLIANFEGVRVGWIEEDRLEVAARGALLLAAVAEGPEPEHTHGIVRFSDAGPWSETFFCVGEGSAVQVVDVDGAQQVSMTLRNLSKIGACPGEPVGGDIEICYDVASEPSVACESNTQSVHLDGVDLDTEVLFSAALTSIETGLAIVDTHLPALGQSVFDVVPDPLVGGTVQTATIPAGYVVMPEGGPDAGAVYCLGGGTLEYKIGFSNGVIPLHAVLTSVSRIGTCGEAVEGEIRVCADL